MTHGADSINRSDNSEISIFFEFDNSSLTTGGEISLTTFAKGVV